MTEEQRKFPRLKLLVLRKARQRAVGVNHWNTNRQDQPVVMRSIQIAALLNSAVFYPGQLSDSYNFMISTLQSDFLPSAVACSFFFFFLAGSGIGPISSK